MPDLKLKIGTEADTSGLKKLSASGVEAGRVINDLEIASQGGVRGFIALGNAAKNSFKLIGTAIAASPMLAFAAAVTAVVGGFAAWAQKVKNATDASIALSNAQDTLKEHTAAMVASGVAGLDQMETKLRNIISLFSEIEGDIAQNTAHTAEMTNATKQLELSKLAPGDEAGKAAIEKKYTGIEASNRTSSAQVSAEAARTKNEQVQGIYGAATKDIEGVRSRLANAKGAILRDKKGNIIDSPANQSAVHAAVVLEAQLRGMQPGYDANSAQANSSSVAADRASRAVTFARELGGVQNATANSRPSASSRTTSAFDADAYTKAQGRSAAAESALFGRAGLSSAPENAAFAQEANEAKAALQDMGRYYKEVVVEIKKTKKQQEAAR